MTKEKRRRRRPLERNPDDSRLYNLMLGVNVLQSEVQRLTMTRDVMATRALVARENQRGSMLSTSVRVFNAFRNGYQPQQYNHLSRKINLQLPTPGVRFENLSFAVPVPAEASKDGTVGSYIRKALAGKLDTNNVGGEVTDSGLHGEQIDLIKFVGLELANVHTAQQ